MAVIDGRAFSKRLRQAIGIRKQRDVAEAAGITPQQLSKYLHEQLPSIDVLVRLALSLECSMDWLLVGKHHHAGEERQRRDIAYLTAELSEQRPDILILFNLWCVLDKKSKATILRLASALNKARNKTRLCVEELSKLFEEKVAMK